MLRVTIELVPFGEESIKRTLETMEIYNDSVLPDENGEYKYYYKLDNIEPFIKNSKLNKDREVYRGELWLPTSCSVWSLIKDCLNTVKEL